MNDLTKMLFLHISYWIFIVFLIFFIVYAITLAFVSETKCENVCEEKGTIFYDRIASGNWKVDDLCVCYLDNKIEMVRLRG